MYSEQPKSWKFIVPNTDVTEQEEVVLSVQGIIMHMDFPPFTKRYADRRLRTRQHLTKCNLLRNERKVTCIRVFS